MCGNKILDQEQIKSFQIAYIVLDSKTNNSKSEENHLLLVSYQSVGSYTAMTPAVRTQC